MPRATSGGLCIDGSGKVETINALRVLGAYSDFSGGSAGAGGILSLTTTSTAAQDQGAEIALGGKTGNAVATYAFGGIKCAKQTAAGDGNYGGYCAWYTDSSAGSLLQRMKLDDAGNLTVTGTPSSTGHNACGGSSGVPCGTTITCSLSAATTCSGTATVPVSSVCTVTANASDTTTGEETFKSSLSTNTLTVTATVASSQTSTVAGNVGCL